MGYITMSTDVARPPDSTTSPLAAAGRRTLALLLALLASATFAAPTAAPDTGPRDDFSPLVKLAPFVVNGETLAVSIHARSNGDRRYAEEFSEAVMKVVWDGVTDSTAKGLVIIGQKGEPHPITVFRKFQALAAAGKLDPAVAARAPELAEMLEHWQHEVHQGDGKGTRIEITKDSDEDGDVDLAFEQIVTALPLPLQGVGAKLYQLAWAEKFDDAKVEAKLIALRPVDLDRDLFARYDWVFYLPPKGAFDAALDRIIAETFKKEEAGFFARAAVKTAMLVVKPKIRRAIEGLRRGVMFQTVVQARTKFSAEEVSALMGAYIETMMPGEKSTGGTEHERAVKAVRAQVRKNAEKAAAVNEPADKLEVETAGGEPSKPADPK
jgi:hypothetical protein